MPVEIKKFNPNRSQEIAEKVKLSVGLDSDDYNEKIHEEVCKKYSLSTQIAIVRKALAHLGCDLPEFVEFNSYVEEIKKASKDNEIQETEE